VINYIQSGDPKGSLHLLVNEILERQGEILNGTLDVLWFGEKKDILATIEEVSLVDDEDFDSQKILDMIEWFRPLKSTIRGFPADALVDNENAKELILINFLENASLLDRAKFVTFFTEVWDGILVKTNIKNNIFG